MKRLVGKVKNFDDAKGYGMLHGISNVCEGQDIFVHYSAIIKQGNEFRTLKPGQFVDFDLVIGPKGPLATSVTIIEFENENER